MAKSRTMASWVMGQQVCIVWPAYVVGSDRNKMGLHECASVSDKNENDQERMEYSHRQRKISH